MDINKPIHYSTKLWCELDLNESLNEILSDISIDDENFKIKDELNQNIWDDDVLNPNIKKILLKNAIEFIKFAKLDKFKFNDIIITGSIANYNWNDNSDIDLHVLMDTNLISDDNEMVDEYLNLNKDKWNNTINSKINDHDIELYVQDINEPHKSTGVYSIVNDKWLRKPIKQMVTIDREIVEKKANDIVRMIDSIVESTNDKEKHKVIRNIIDKLKKYRTIGLNRDGEFSTENLVFKMLRYGNVLKDLIEIKNNILTKSLSD